MGCTNILLLNWIEGDPTLNFPLLIRWKVLGGAAGRALYVWSQGMEAEWNQ